MPFAIKFSIEYPSKKFGDIHVQTALAQKQRNVTSQDIIRDFEGTVEGWQERPNFAYKSIVNSMRVAIQVYPTGRGKSLYQLINAGSPSHIITAKRPGGFLHFQTGYKSATHAGSLTSGPKVRFGRYRSTYFVNHPGFEARDFIKLIGEKNRDKFAFDMQEAVNEAVRSR